MALQLTCLVELNYFNYDHNEIFTHTLLQLRISVYLYENSVFNTLIEMEDEGKTTG